MASLVCGGFVLVIVAVITPATTKAEATGNNEGYSVPKNKGAWLVAKPVQRSAQWQGLRNNKV